MGKSVSYIATLLIGSAVLACAGLPGPAYGASLEITFTGIEEETGNLMVSLFDKAEPFPSDFQKALANAQEAVTSETMTIRFTNIAPGSYSVSAYHDVNANGELDRGLFNAPTEPYGFSNNARGAFGPPKFEETLFPVFDGKTEIEIDMR